ncbi:MAG: hypothetical protein FWF33_04135 [Clostridiales bacterium]|nr:hypothetical protein [Clostridiales bacterium]
MARRIIAILTILILGVTVFSACGKTGGGAAAFNTGAWMDDKANAMQFQYIAVYDGDAYSAADEADQQWILSALKDVNFDPIGEISDMRPDFAFAMNEPFLFFGFTESGALIVKEPKETSYAYYEAKAETYPQLSTLRARLDEMRQANAQPGLIVGGYSADRDVTPDDLGIFRLAMKGAGADVSYEPTRVATQVVAGLNYRFTATATPRTGPSGTYTVQITIFKPLQGDPQLTNIVRVQ